MTDDSMQPSGRSKVVQPLEPGRVEAILVENGARVEAGDVLLELDPTETAAEQNAQRLEPLRKPPVAKPPSPPQNSTAAT